MSSNSVANDPTSRLRSRLSRNAKYVLLSRNQLTRHVTTLPSSFFSLTVRYLAIPLASTRRAIDSPLEWRTSARALQAFRMKNTKAIGTSKDKQKELICKIQKHLVARHTEILPQ